MSIISIQNLEDYLQKDISGTTDETKYEFLIESVQDLADKICNRKFEEDDYDEVFDMDGQEVFLNQMPITDISLVEYGSPFGDVNRTELDTTDYIRYDKIGVLRLNITDRRQPQYVRVVYTAGYDDDTVPQDLKNILMDKIEGIFNKNFASPELKSEKIGDYKWERFSIADQESTSIFAEKLSKYVISVV